jgi:hypothetical protein
MNTQMNQNQIRYVSYNNFTQQQQQQPIRSQIQPQIPKIDPNDEEAIGEYLYSIVEKFYPE